MDRLGRKYVFAGAAAGSRIQPRANSPVDMNAQAELLRGNWSRTIRKSEEWKKLLRDVAAKGNVVPAVPGA